MKVGRQIAYSFNIYIYYARSNTITALQRRLIILHINETD